MLRISRRAVKDFISIFITEFRSLQVSDKLEQAVGYLTPGVGQYLWFILLASQVLSAQMPKSGTPHICAEARCYKFQIFLKTSLINQ